MIVLILLTSTLTQSLGFVFPAAKPLALKKTTFLSAENGENLNTNDDRKDLWKSISKLEKEAVELLMSGDESSVENANKLLSKSIALKMKDPFIQLANLYSVSESNSDAAECERLLAAMKNVGVPPHLASVVTRGKLQQQQAATISKQAAATPTRTALPTTASEGDELDKEEILDDCSNFSDTVTEKIRVKVVAHFDPDKSDPDNGRYMFWYRVRIFNEGSEPVQVVARMWEIAPYGGEVETVRGQGIANTQPIVAAGDVFTYQSVCPLKVFPPKGRRVLGSLSGAFTMCKGNMGQHNFAVKAGKLSFIIPETSKRRSS